MLFQCNVMQYELNVIIIVFIEKKYKLPADIQHRQILLLSIDTFLFKLFKRPEVKHATSV